MSIKLMTRVWELDLDHSTQITLLALADHADDDGNNVYPSVGYLAWKTGYSHGQMKRIMRMLRDEMMVLELVEEGGGRGKANRYRLNLDACEYKQPYDGPNRLTDGLRSALLDDLLEEHERTCSYCGHRGTDEIGPDGRIWHVDRRVTGRQGGKYERGNVTLACATCNLSRHRSPRHKKGDATSPFEEWKETHLKGVNENDKGGHGDDKGDEKGVRANTKRGSGRTIKGVTAMTPEPTENHKQEPSVTEEEVANAPSSSGGPGPPKGGQSRKQNNNNNDVVVSYKQFGVARIMERVREAKEQGKKPAPVGNADLRRYGDLYEACLTRDGYEVEDLEPALDYLVQCACGEGEDWLAGKKRWIPLVDALSFRESARDPARDLANAKANTKPRATVWYLAFFDAAQEERVEDMKKRGMDHDAIVTALEADDRRVRSAAS